MVLKPNIYVLYQKMERLDSILKSVVTSSTVVSVESSPSTLPGDTNLVIAKPEPEEPREEAQVQAQVQSQVQGWCGKFWLHKYNLSSVYFLPL